eukprot:g11119.t1
MRTAALDDIGDQLASTRKLDDRFETRLPCLAELSSENAMLRCSGYTKTSVADLLIYYLRRDFRITQTTLGEGN